MKILEKNMANGIVDQNISFLDFESIFEAGKSLFPQIANIAAIVDCLLASCQKPTIYRSFWQRCQVQGPEELAPVRGRPMENRRDFFYQFQIFWTINPSSTHLGHFDPKNFASPII